MSILAAFDTQRPARGYYDYGKELTESWAALQARIQAGDFSGIHIGDYKTIKMTNNETVVCEVAGIDTYYKCTNQQAGHHVDFISRDCLAGTKQFNTTNTNNGNATSEYPWRASALFNTLNDETTGVYSMLPADLKAVIVEKRMLQEKRYSASGALDKSTGWGWESMGKLWVPFEVEVFPYASWSQPVYGIGNGIQYPIFYGGYKHIIKGAGNGGGRCSWWEASAMTGSSTNVCSVYSNGGAGSFAATYASIYAPLCFRIG